MVNRITLLFSMAFWLVMMSLLFRYDILPGYIIEDNPGYEAITRSVDAPLIRTMAVLQDGNEVGTSHTVINPEPDGTYAIANVTSLKVKVGFVETRVSAVLNVTVDANKELDQFFLDVDLGGQGRAEVVGKRDGDNLHVELTIGGERLTEDFPYDNAIIASYFNPFPLGSRLKVGQNWKTKFLDPLSQQSRTVDIKVVRREPIEISVRRNEPPQRFDTYKVVTDYNGAELAAWATEDGVVLREETPLGYTLEYREDNADDST